VLSEFAVGLKLLLVYGDGLGDELVFNFGNVAQVLNGFFQALNNLEEVAGGGSGGGQGIKDDAKLRFEPGYVLVWMPSAPSATP
jgi:hypothetical protein